MFIHSLWEIDHIQKCREIYAALDILGGKMKYDATQGGSEGPHA